MLRLHSYVAQDVGKDSDPYAQSHPNRGGLRGIPHSVKAGQTEHLSRDEDTRESVSFQLWTAGNMNEE